MHCWPIPCPLGECPIENPPENPYQHAVEVHKSQVENLKMLAERREAERSRQERNKSVPNIILPRPIPEYLQLWYDSQLRKCEEMGYWEELARHRERMKDPKNHPRPPPPLHMLPIPKEFSSEHYRGIEKFLGFEGPYKKGSGSASPDGIISAVPLNSEHSPGLEHSLGFEQRDIEESGSALPDVNISAMPHNQWPLLQSSNNQTALSEGETRPTSSNSDETIPYSSGSQSRRGSDASNKSDPYEGIPPLPAPELFAYGTGTDVINTRPAIASPMISDPSNIFQGRRGSASSVKSNP